MQYKDVPILMYHDISDYDSPWCVSPEAFAEQMHFLYSRGYKTISLERLKEKVEDGGSTEEKLVAIYLHPPLPSLHLHLQERWSYSHGHEGTASALQRLREKRTTGCHNQRCHDT